MRVSSPGRKVKQVVTIKLSVLYRVVQNFLEVLLQLIVILLYVEAEAGVEHEEEERGGEHSGGD